MNNVIEILNPIFSSDSYKYNKSRRTWVKENENIVVLCEYQKSRYSSNFFINLGVYFRDFNHENKKKIVIDECHLIARYDQIFQDFSALDIKDEYFDDFDELEKELSFTKEIISKKLLPMLNNMLDFGYMRLNFENYPNENWWLQNITEEDYLSIFKVSS